MKTPITLEQIEALRGLDTCLVGNAIERFHVRLLNEGFCDSSIHCFFPQLPPLVGYAATAKIRCSTPPLDASRFGDRFDWYEYIRSLPEPRVLVIEDVDPSPGLGAMMGEVHVAIQQALGCVGLVTSGAVRDLPQVAAMGFHCFAGNIAVSHAYSHIVSFGEPVKVAGLEISPGDLLHGDQHGVLTIPLEIAGEIPAVAARIAEQDRRVVALCQSPDFNLEKLRALVNNRRKITPAKRR